MKSSHPKAVVGTETRTPTLFYTTDGAPKVDDPEHDIASITTYLQQLTDAAVIGDSQPPRTPPIDWSSAPY
jgi:hypothetical protein